MVSMWAALSVCFFALFLKFIPVTYLLLPSWTLDEAYAPLASIDISVPYEGAMPGLLFGLEPSIRVGPHGFLLVISPHTDVPAVDLKGSQTLHMWHERNTEWIDNAILTYGGILFRGWQVVDEFDFDDLVASLHSSQNGTGIYLGTAPRLKIPGTRFVSTASEITRLATIPTHLELCFTPNPPETLYFYCGLANYTYGGQTPLADFRAVWRNLPTALRDKFVSKGLMYTRMYYNGEYSRPLDPLQSKSWQDMFKTRSKSEVEERARAQQFATEWDARDNLLLRHLAVINRTHAKTQEPYWSTHFNVLHAPTFHISSSWTAQLFSSRRSAALAYFFAAWLHLRQWLGYEYGHNMVYADDDSQVEWEEAMLVRREISRQTWCFDWMEGDVLAIDNHRIAHGRMPYYGGERRVFVAWA